MAEEITELLIAWGDGDPAALERLMPLVYDELRRLARGYLRREANQSVLEPTALVHEAYLRLANQERSSWQSRSQFYGLAAKIMRDLLVDHARRRRAAKHGGGAERLSLGYADRHGRRQEVDLLLLDEALRKLSAVRPGHGRVVELRFFGGLTIEEAAEVLGRSHATVERQWNLARAWLFRELGGQFGAESDR